MVADIHRALGECFNTQPPEGGWFNALSLLRELQGFNTQPPEGGWHTLPLTAVLAWEVSTHSRLKAAGASAAAGTARWVFQHTAA